MQTNNSRIILKDSLGRWLIYLGFLLSMAFPILLFNNIVKAADENSSPQNQGATYVGMETCAACHEEVFDRFKLTSHYHGIADEEDLGGGCESCHGAGSIHAETMDKKDIARYSAENCFSCHMDKKAQFQMQFHHPVNEGWIECTDCHKPHSKESEVMSIVSLQKSDQICFECHKEMKGPFVFEHDPMRDGCQTCHEPHGSVYDKMLIADQTTLCLRCHWEPSFNTSGSLGGVNHSGYYIGRGEECVDHHRAPHGSNIWKTLNR